MTNSLKVRILGMFLKKSAWKCGCTSINLWYKLMACVSSTNRGTKTKKKQKNEVKMKKILYITEPFLLNHCCFLINQLFFAEPCKNFKKYHFDGKNYYVIWLYVGKDTINFVKTTHV